MTFNEFIDYLGNLEMTMIIGLLIIIFIMFALMPFINALSEAIANALFGAIERAWKFVTGWLR